jgi:ADP-ribose pyrophosphatase
MSEPAPEQILSSRQIYHGRIVTLEVVDVVLPNGRRAIREIVKHPGAVVIVAPDDRGRVAMVRQYRTAAGRELLELPAGTREPNESADECARRELVEEMGLTAAHWTNLGGFYSAPGFCTEYLTLFLATGLTSVEGHPEADEWLRREWIDLARVPAMIASGEICDAKSIAGLLRYLQGLTQGE